jgi:cupin fold WbuC family metalloprotein
MSTPFFRNQSDLLSLVPLDETLLQEASSAANDSPRKRSIIRFHEHDEPVQRMLNAIEPESYARPHKHLAKPEAFVALRGSLLVVRYSDNGDPTEAVVVSEDGPCRGVEIPPGAWHSIVALQEGTVIFEVSQGPYDPATHKVFAPWAPPEEDREAGLAFIARLRSQFDRLVPAVAARDQIDAEDDIF